MLLASMVNAPVHGSGGTGSASGCTEPLLPPPLLLGPLPLEDVLPPESTELPEELLAPGGSVAAPPSSPGSASTCSWIPHATPATTHAAKRARAREERTMNPA
jgi:hypothetical protein